MSLPIPICPLLKGEETVMMIIRLGNIFPLSYFRLISQIPPRLKKPMQMRMRARLKCTCVSLMQFQALPRKQETTVQVSVLCSWRQFTCHGRFVILHTVSPSFPHFGLSSWDTCHRSFHFDFKNITPTYIYPPYPHAEVTLAR